MTTTYYTDIQTLYVTYFGRAADPSGMAFWEVAVEQAGGSTAGVAAAFAQSAEYQATYANLDDAAVVNSVYEHLFGRAAEATGVEYWSRELANGTVTIDTAVTAIAAGAQGTDLATLTNRVTAATVFTNAIDTDAEVQAYKGAVADDVVAHWLAQVTDSASLAAAIDPAAIQKIIDELLADSQAAVAYASDAAARLDQAVVAPHEAGMHAAIVGVPAAHPGPVL